LLAHGADPNSLHAYSRRPQREEALIHGHVEMAKLLERFGAETTTLEGPSAFRAACMSLDREAARAIVASQPIFLGDVAHGADIDRPTAKIGGGAMGFAAHFDRREIAAFLAPLSRDVHNLTYLGFKDRLAELFATDPALVNARHDRIGCTPLFLLPADEVQAMRWPSSCWITAPTRTSETRRMV
jgi:hypothetical protein